MVETPQQYNGAAQKYSQLLIGNRRTAIAAGVLLTILGILFFIFPLASAFFAGVFIIIGLLVYAIHLIVGFFLAPPHFRDGWQLTQGILMAVTAVFILASSATSIIATFAIILGIIAMMIGVNEIVAYTALKGQQGAGYILASGIINVLLALFLIFAPLAAAGALAFVQGIYLVFTGVALIIEGLAKHPAPQG